MEFENLVVVLRSETDDRVVMRREFSLAEILEELVPAFVQSSPERLVIQRQRRALCRQLLVGLRRAVSRQFRPFNGRRRRIGHLQWRRVMLLISEMTCVLNRVQWLAEEESEIEEYPDSP